jgi:hypothetical protein
MSDQLLEKLYEGAEATSANDLLDLASAAQLPLVYSTERQGRAIRFKLR